MIKSKTKVERQLKNKNNPELVETIVLAKKNPKWVEVASLLTGSRKKRRNVNLDELEGIPSQNVVVCGKVLSDGEISKKLKVVALSFSQKAKEKLLKAGCEVSTIMEEIKKNKDALGVVVLK
ncbi:MAG: uL15 family ribosomal protein [Nanoarchaeota archaeon]|nr:uL15 family ribosomal protein [Nanoarchaeota archaeon]